MKRFMTTRQILITAIAGCFTLMTACSSSQERTDLPEGASTVENSAETAEGNTELAEEAEELGPTEPAQALEAQLPASEDCEAGSLVVDGEPTEVKGIHYQRWIRTSMGEATDHFHFFDEPVTCASSLEESIDTYAMLGHVAAQQFSRRRVDLMSGGKTMAGAPISVSQVGDRLEICIHEPITIEAATGTTYEWNGRFQATGYCETREVNQ
jgi:hypothetical protein